MAASIGFDIFARDRASKTFDKVGKSADQAETKFSKVGDRLKKFGVFAAAGLAVGAAAAIKFGGDAIGSASDLNETLSKSLTIFGKHAGAMEKWAGAGARTMGLSKQAALDAASGFGDMFSQLGFAGNESAKMSKKVVQMSADLGSFNNLPTAEVADMMAGAFRGEYDSLQRLIPNINAARVEQQAMAMTGKENAKSLTAQEKAAATLAIVTKDGARAQGDFKRTSGGLANQQKILKAQFENVQASIGQKLLPMAVKLATWANDKGIPAFQRMSSWLGKTLGPAFRAVGEFIGTKVVPAIQRFVEGFRKGEGAGGKFRKALRDMGPFLKLVGQGLRVLGKFLLWLAPIVGNRMVNRFAQMGRAMGLVGKVGIALWNKALAPTFRLMLRGIGKLMVGWGKMLRAISKVPGFGWAKRAGDRMTEAGRKAVQMGDNIKNIPGKKKVTITTPGMDAALRKAQILAARVAALASASINVWFGGGRPRAAGGPVLAGRPYVVGENRREMFVPSTNGRIMSGAATERAMSTGPRGGGGNFYLTVHVHDVKDGPAAGRAVVKAVKDLAQSQGLRGPRVAEVFAR